MDTEIRHDNEMMFTRNVACAIIEWAMEDAKNNRTYLRANTRNNQSVNRTNAIHFFQGPWYREICSALGLPADKIAREAFTWECSDCGSTEDPWFDRTEPMGYCCRGCGRAVGDDE